MSDSAPISVSKKNRPDDFSVMLKDMVCSFNYKLIFMLFFFFLLVNSDVFMTRILEKFDNAYDYKSPTNYGVVLQGIFLILMYMVADVLIKQDVI